MADGDTITVAELRDTVQNLADATGTDDRERLRAFGQDIQSWAGTAGLDLYIADRRPPTLEHAGPELGL